MKHGLSLKRLMMRFVLFFSQPYISYIWLPVCLFRNWNSETFLETDLCLETKLFKMCYLTTISLIFFFLIHYYVDFGRSVSETPLGYAAVSAPLSHSAWHLNQHRHTVFLVQGLFKPLFLLVLHNSSIIKRITIWC